MMMSISVIHGMLYSGIAIAVLVGIVMMIMGMAAEK